MTSRTRTIAEILKYAIYVFNVVTFALNMLFVIDLRDWSIPWMIVGLFILFTVIPLGIEGARKAHFGMVITYSILVTLEFIGVVVLFGISLYFYYLILFICLFINTVCTYAYAYLIKRLQRTINR